MSDPRKEVRIDYTNWRGERTFRRVIPLSIQFENNEWHPDTQWLLYAVDVEKGAERTFALANIHSWSGYVEEMRERDRRDRNAEIEAAAKLIYDQFPYDGPPGTTKPEWSPFGNSLKQDEARRAARAQLMASKNGQSTHDVSTATKGD